MLNICAGAALISVAAPLALEFCSVSVDQANGFVSAVAIFNGFGRVFWAWLSDTISRPVTFICLFVLQAIAFLMLVNVHENGFGLLVVAGTIIGLCFGGGFGTMPAFVGDIFGDKRAGAIYGVMLTAWSAGGLIGPLFMAVMDSRSAFYVLFAIMLIGICLSVVLWRDLRRLKLQATLTERVQQEGSVSQPSPKHFRQPGFTFDVKPSPKRFSNPSFTFSKAPITISVDTIRESTSEDPSGTVLSSTTSSVGAQDGSSSDSTKKL